MSSSPVVNNTLDFGTVQVHHFKFSGFYIFLDSFVNILSFYRSQQPVRSHKTNCLCCSSWNESSSLSASSEPWCKQFNWNRGNLTQEFHFNHVYFESFWIHLCLILGYRQIIVNSLILDLQGVCHRTQYPRDAGPTDPSPSLHNPIHRIILIPGWEVGI